MAIQVEPQTQAHTANKNTFEERMGKMFVPQFKCGIGLI